MNRQEFIDKLKAALKNSIPPAVVADYVSYYEGYIRSEMQTGKSEEAVLAALGDPRLIARTIIQTNTTEQESGSYSGGGYRDSSYRDNSYQDSSYQDRSYENNYGDGRYRQAGSRTDGGVVRRFQIPGWVWGLIVILVFVLIIGIIMSVLSFLAPILIPIVVVGFLVKLFRDWLN